MRYTLPGSSRACLPLRPITLTILECLALVCSSLSFAPLGLVVLKMRVPPRSECWQPTGCPNAHACAVTKWRTWSEAESCAGGLLADNTARGGLAKFRNLGWKEVQPIPCRTYRRALCSTHWERVASKVSKASKLLTLLTLLTLTRIHPVAKNPTRDASFLAVRSICQFRGFGFLPLEVRGTGCAQRPRV
jgi:hypothetical protein